MHTRRLSVLATTDNVWEWMVWSDVGWNVRRLCRNSHAYCIPNHITLVNDHSWVHRSTADRFVHSPKKMRRKKTKAAVVLIRRFEGGVVEELNSIKVSWDFILPGLMRLRAAGIGRECEPQTETECTRPGEWKPNDAHALEQSLAHHKKVSDGSLRKAENVRRELRRCPTSLATLKLSIACWHSAHKYSFFFIFSFYFHLPFSLILAFKDTSVWVHCGFVDCTVQYCWIENCYWHMGHATRLEIWRNFEKRVVASISLSITCRT